MNVSLLRKFTPQILTGAEQEIGRDAVAKLLSVSPRTLADMKAGLKPLSNACARLIEGDTGKGLGELALLGVVANASPEERAANAELIRDTLQLERSLDAALNGSPKPRSRRKATAR
jgi:hypothetical protein